MNLLSHFFRSVEQREQDLVHKDEDVVRLWEEYRKTVPEKERIASTAPFDSRAFLSLLKVGLIEDMEHDDEAIIEDITKIDHDRWIRTIHRIEQCLLWAERKYEYVYELLKELHMCLMQEQARTIYEKRTHTGDLSLLQKDIRVEITIIQKIDTMNTFGGDPNTFHSIFLGLLNGEQTIKIYSAREKELANIMDDRMSRKMPSGQITTWINAVEAGMEEALTEAIINRRIHERHSHSDFEFVNRPPFEDLVRKGLISVKKEPVTPAQRAFFEELVAMFVALYRERYNTKDL